MNTMLPSQIIEYLDSCYPQAKDQLEGRGGKWYLPIDHVAKVAQLLLMVENIPPSLMNLKGEDQVEFGEAIEAIRFAINAWNSGDKHFKLEKIPGRQGLNPITLLRKVLIKLSDKIDQPDEANTKKEEMENNVNDSTKVFVVHGRDSRLRDDFFSFLGALGLKPIEWSEALKLTGKTTPYIGEVLDHAFENAQAVIVLLSPDDEVRLSPELWKDSESYDQKLCMR